MSPAKVVVAVGLGLLLAGTACNSTYREPEEQASGDLPKRAAESAVRSAFLELAWAQEAFFKEHGAYSSSLTTLELTHSDASVSLEIVVATKEGWVGVGKKQPADCLLFYGIPPPESRPLIDEYGANEGVVACK